MREDGQASVELVALLPLMVVVIGLVWQAVVAGQSLWLAGAAARASARAAAVGGDLERSARGVLPPRLERGLSVRASGAGVAVRVRIPTVVGDRSLGTVTRHAAFPVQAS